MSESPDTLPSPAELAGLVEISPAPLWLGNGDGSRRFFNSAWYLLTGRDPQAELGWGWLEGVHEEDRERVQRTISTACSTGRLFRTRYRVAGPRAEWRTLEEHGNPVLRDGAVEYWHGSCRDVTQESAERNRYREFAQLVETLASEQDRASALDALIVAFNTSERRAAIWSWLAGDEFRLESAPGLSHLSPASTESLAAPIRQAVQTRKPVIATDLVLAGDSFQPRTVWALPIPSVKTGAFAVFFEAQRLPSDDQVELLSPWTSLAGLLLRSRDTHA